MWFRKVILSLLGTLMTTASLLSGCGGAQDGSPGLARRPPASQRIAEREIIEAPEATVLQLKACVDARPGPWGESYHALMYDVTANKGGDVSKVTLRDATLRDTALEACFKKALVAMEVPAEALRSHSSKPVSGQSRAAVGIVQAVAAPIALAPILIPALGVTIIVAISIDIVRNVTSGPDCKEVKEDCIIACNRKLPTGDYGFRFWNCVNQCMRTAGC